MNLSTIKTGPSRRPPRVVIYGTGGVGKTTWSCDAPQPILLPTEDGIGNIEAARFPQAHSLLDVNAAIEELINKPHSFRTLVIDSLDHLEPLIHAATCEVGGKRSIEDFGYGKGYVEALGFWRGFFDRVDALRETKNMAVIMIAHCEIRTFQDPASDGWDRYQIKLHKSAAALVYEWADAILFATHRAESVKEKDSKRTRGMGTGERVVLTDERPSHVAKNRWGLPYELPLQFSAFAAAMAGARAIKDAAAAPVAPASTEPTTAGTADHSQAG